MYFENFGLELISNQIVSLFINCFSNLCCCCSFRTLLPWELYHQLFRSEQSLMTFFTVCRSVYQNTFLVCQICKHTQCNFIQVPSNKDNLTIVDFLILSISQIQKFRKCNLGYIRSNNKYFTNKSNLQPQYKFRQIPSNKICNNSRLLFYELVRFTKSMYFRQISINKGYLTILDIYVNNKSVEFTMSVYFRQISINKDYITILDFSFTCIYLYSSANISCKFINKKVQSVMNALKQILNVH